jgi:hypothetical protein
VVGASQGGSQDRKAQRLHGSRRSCSTQISLGRATPRRVHYNARCSRRSGCLKCRIGKSGAEVVRHARNLPARACCCCSTTHTLALSPPHLTHLSSWSGDAPASCAARSATLPRTARPLSASACVSMPPLALSIPLTPFSSSTAPSPATRAARAPRSARPLPSSATPAARPATSRPTAPTRPRPSRRARSRRPSRARPRRRAA